MIRGQKLVGVFLGALTLCGCGVQVNAIISAALTAQHPHDPASKTSLCDTARAAQAPSDPFAENLKQDISWKDAIGVAASNGTLSKSAIGSSGWNAGAASTQSIPYGYGYVEFVASQSNTQRSIGLSSSDNAGTDYTDIDYAIFLRADGFFKAYQREPTRYLDAYTGSYQAGDRFRISVEEGVVRFYKNGTLFYTSQILPTYPLSVDTAFDTPGARLDQVKISIPLAWPDGHDLYVSPNGTAYGNGTPEHPLDLATALSGKRPVKPGDTLWLCGGTYHGSFTSNLIGQEDNPIVVRGYTGERATLDGNMAPRHDLRALTIAGSDTWFRDIEVMNSDPIRVTQQAGSDPTDVPRESSCVDLLGTRVKIINSVVHDLGDGIGAHGATDSEAYGNLVYNNGWSGPDRGHGHGFYVQNQYGTLTIRDNVSFSNFATAGKSYGSDQSFLNGFTYDGNAFIANGIGELLIGGGSPASRIQVTNNFTYLDGVVLGYSNPFNVDAQVEGNYLYSTSPLQFKYWQTLQVRNNTLIAIPDNQSVVLSIWEPDTSSTQTDYIFSGNTYYRGRLGTLISFAIRDWSGTSTGYTYPQWQGLGFDPDGAYISNPDLNGVTRPTGVKVFVRPNAYEAGRANIIIYNWDNLDSVGADLSIAGLAAGDHFEIRDAENFYGAPVVSGTYSGGLVQLPMKGLQAAKKIGNPPEQPAHTPAEFGAFVLLKR